MEDLEPDNAPDKHFLYRCFDKDGALLYVGISMRLGPRFDQHRRKGWWLKVHEVRAVAVGDQLAAERAEALAILDEKPAHNGRDMNGRYVVPTKHRPGAEIPQAPKPNRGETWEGYARRLQSSWPKR